MDIQAVNQGIQNNLETVSKNNTAEIQSVRQNQNISKEVKHGAVKQDNQQEENIKKAVEKLNKFLEGEKTHVEYERHDKFKNEFIIKIINDQTKEVIKEIPPKKMLDMVAEMCKLAGIMFDEKA
ncbi:flagellar protein FlaG [Clostridium sp. ZS2-4]|uniref:flagellar protein FlaG n=1 Tax=Clostridium sp. ZS2-4 TaxID=2987703 RepID=UPI00227B389F|nr:flagellar protein FlaG [Clostridium sp. ZS2-4]MCY6353963.1 flagellar protein FlaG [Clostridium sp. ZS2-4]